MCARSCGVARFSMLFALAAVAGCGDSVARPRTVPVTGTVYYKDQPVVGATVSFWTENAPRAATGTTDQEGKFYLSTFEPKDGAIPGEHIVTVSKRNEATQKSTAPDMSAMNDPSKLTQMYNQTKDAAMADDASKDLLPARYSDQKASPLKETVTENGPNQFPLILND